MSEITWEVCSDNRFEIIENAKQMLLEHTNIETRPEEMAVLDNILFRMWQMGWLPENYPLNWDQMKGMVGEPVYLKKYWEFPKGQRHCTESWILIKEFYKDVKEFIIDSNGYSFEKDDFANKDNYWQAYRSKPEDDDIPLVSYVGYAERGKETSDLIHRIKDDMERNEQ